MTQAVEQDQIESHEAPWHAASQVKEAEYQNVDAPEHAVETAQADAGQGDVSSGGWVLKIHPKHACIFPVIDNQTFVGSIWKCGGCGQHWSVFEKKTAKGEATVGEKAFKRISEEVVAKRLANRASDEDQD